MDEPNDPLSSQAMYEKHNAIVLANKKAQNRCKRAKLPTDGYNYLVESGCMECNR